MHPLAKFLMDNEIWLMRRIRDYAVARGYSRYTSTLEEAWRISIGGLNKSIESALGISEKPMELKPDDDFISDPIAAFGVQEAQNHRSRGVTLEMFMGLMKYYRQTYHDLINSSEADALPDADGATEEKNRPRYRKVVDRVFDRIEIAFCAEWCRNEQASRSMVELQKANRRITNEKNKFLTIFESLPAAVFMLDEERHIINVNLAGARMMDKTAKSGAHYYNTPASKMRFPWLSEALSRFHSTGEGKETECRITVDGGDTRQMLAYFHPLADISFKFIGTVVILNDITEWKKAEEELKQAQRFMMQQEKMASIGQLAAGVAHEINNPMNFIMSNLRMLADYIDRLARFITAAENAIDAAGTSMAHPLSALREELDLDYMLEDAGVLISENLAGTERVSRIVRDLNAFSRVDHAEYTLTDLNHIMETAINIAANEIKYVADLKRDLGNIPKIKCYPQQLTQVFLNLLINAAQAIHQKGTITVRSWCNNTHVHLSVTDTGSGISPENISRIFDPFFTTKEVGKGTGLGLSISYGIVRNHGGDLSVESQVDSGTTFSLKLPIV